MVNAYQESIFRICWNHPRDSVIYIPFHDGCWNCIHSKKCSTKEKVLVEKQTSSPRVGTNSFVRGGET